MVRWFSRLTRAFSLSFVSQVGEVDADSDPSAGNPSGGLHLRDGRVHHDHHRAASHQALHRPLLLLLPGWTNLSIFEWFMSKHHGFYGVRKYEISCFKANGMNQVWVGVSRWIRDLETVLRHFMGPWVLLFILHVDKIKKWIMNFVLGERWESWAPQKMDRHASLGWNTKFKALSLFSNMRRTRLIGRRTTAAENSFIS